jgi:hypothetical protein
MQNKNPKHIKEHRKRSIAAFNDLVRRWIPEEYLRADATLADAPLRQVAYFMIFDWCMSTGGEDEVILLIGYLRAALEKVETIYGEGTANN